MNLKILDEKRKKVFEILKKLSFLDRFEMGGGTALALQIGHRVSVDFDFFANDSLDEKFLENLEKELPKIPLGVSVSNKEELTVFLDGVKVTFLHYPFPSLLPVVDLDGIRALSVLEIASTKAYTIGRRVEYKDYVDLYFILKEQDISLEDIIELCNKKYGSRFNSRLFLEQLVYGDVEEVELKFFKNAVSKEEVFEFFEDLVSNFELKS
jgi:hypothetical protein